MSSEQWCTQTSNVINLLFPWAQWRKWKYQTHVKFQIIIYTYRYKKKKIPFTRNLLHFNYKSMNVSVINLYKHDALSWKHNDLLYTQKNLDVGRLLRNKRRQVFHKHVAIQQHDFSISDRRSNSKDTQKSFRVSSSEYFCQQDEHIWPLLSWMKDLFLQKRRKEEKSTQRNTRAREIWPTGGDP